MLLAFTWKDSSTPLGSSRGCVNLLSASVQIRVTLIIWTHFHAGHYSTLTAFSKLLRHKVKEKIF